MVGKMDVEPIILKHGKIVAFIIIDSEIIVGSFILNITGILVRM